MDSYHDVHVNLIKFQLYDKESFSNISYNQKHIYIQYKFVHTKYPKQGQLVRTDYRLDIQCFEIPNSNIVLFKRYLN
jgi:hypothetical protein